jgi:hypothetical protein
MLRLRQAGASSGSGAAGTVVVPGVGSTSSGTIGSIRSSSSIADSASSPITGRSISAVDGRPPSKERRTPGSRRARRATIGAQSAAIDLTAALARWAAGSSSPSRAAVQAPEAVNDQADSEPVSPPATASAQWRTSPNSSWRARCACRRTRSSVSSARARVAES